MDAPARLAAFPLPEALAGVFAYPGDALDRHVAAAQEALAALDPQLGAIFEPAAVGLGATGTAEREELFTRTFDINPTCTLEIGWHLFGEEYERGAFLVEMRRRLRETGLEEGGELPDHLSCALRLLGRLDGGRPEAEEVSAFARGFLLPALVKMLTGFGERENPYRAALEATRGWLERRYGPALERRVTGSVRPAPYPPSSACGTGCSAFAE